jgi:apolipoprotein N-acyltransferase
VEEAALKEQQAARRSTGRAQRGAAERSSWGWGVAYVLATALAFPFEVGGRVIDLGLAFAWWPPVLLFLAVRGLAPRRAAWRGFLLGTLAHAVVWHWIYVVTVRYGHAPAWVGLVTPPLLATYPGLFMAAFAALSRGLGPFALALLWTALEHGRSFLLTGFPWATLGYAQHENSLLLGLAPWAGVYALCFANALGGFAVLVWALRREPGRSARRAAAAAAAVLALHAAGALGRGDAEPGVATLRVAALQGNLSQSVKWSPEWAERTLGIYERLTREAAAQGARLVVWPETAVPGAPDADPELEARLAALARETNAALVVGALGLAFDEHGELAHIYDSALLYDASGARLDRYDKSHLVPYGEYLPFRALLGRFIRAVATGAIRRDASAGPGPRVLTLPAPGGAEPAVTLGVPICYELLFPNLVRRFGSGGAQVLLAITNDAWYGRTGAPHQFLAITALRSAENGAFTVRAANTGVSALIDARGRVRERTRIFEEALLVGDVPLRDPASPPTFYARAGEWFPLACWLASAGLLGARAWRRRTAGGAA